MEEDFSQDTVSNSGAGGCAYVHKKSSMPLLMLGALGVVFGDIGTSPLYALKETFVQTGTAVDPLSIMRFLSMIFWLLLIVVSIKYVAFVMRASNKGEGGNFALLALVLRLTRPSPKLYGIMGLLGIASGSLFYADAVITPAISVLSAVEGIEVIAPQFEHYIMPITMIILIALFFVQKQGTGKVGALFGPVMLIWFTTLGFLGVVQILNAPEVLKALNPLYAVEFIFASPHLAFMALGAALLAVTGAEALYADMGHFGAKPINTVWLFFVWPGLLLNYFGQGALLIQRPETIENPFYLMAPSDFFVPLLLLSTFATIIASQAVISGAFSLTRQAIQLGYLPRMRISHTSSMEEGQIYMPFINWILLMSVLLVVLIFKSSSGLTAAYGLAVTGTMTITSIMVAVVMYLKWQWKKRYISIIVGAFLIIDATLLASASLKLFTGGYVPVLIAIVIFTALTTWKTGQHVIDEKLSKNTVSVERFIKEVEKNPPIRVPGTAIYMNPRHNVVPSTLLYNLKHNKILHEHVIFLTVISQDIPHVEAERRLQIQELGNNFYQLDLYNGFQDTPDVPSVLEHCHARGIGVHHIYQATFFLGRETVVPVKGGEMMTWRDALFAFMKQNASSAAAFYSIPADRVCELGGRYEI